MFDDGDISKRSAKFTEWTEDARKRRVKLLMIVYDPSTNCYYPEDATDWNDVAAKREIHESRGRRADDVFFPTA